MGGGQLGYLALVPTTIIYNSIHNATYFARPTHPGILTVVMPLATRANAVPLTAQDIATQKSQHDEALRLYNEYQTVEQALRTHIIDVVPSE